MKYGSFLHLFSTGIARASSLFPILSTILLMMGGLCVGVGRVYSKRNNILLSAGILFVAAGRTRLAMYTQINAQGGYTANRLIELIDSLIVSLC